MGVKIKEQIICKLCNQPIEESLALFDDEDINKGFVHSRCKSSTTKPLVIDIALIKSLRYQGKNREATELLRVFRESVDAEKKQVAKELSARDRQIIAMNCRKLNICRMCKVKPPMEGIILCEECRDEKRRKYKESVLAKKRKQELKQKQKNKQKKSSGNK